MCVWKSLSRVQLFTVHGILQARILEWVAFPFSRGSSQPRDQTQVSCVTDGIFTSWATKKLTVNYYGWHITKYFYMYHLIDSSQLLLGTMVSHLPEVSTSVDSTYLKSKVFREKKNSRQFQRAKLEFANHGQLFREHLTSHLQLY